MPPPNKLNESELFTKYKSSYKSAFLDLSIHTFLFSSSFYLLWLFRNSWLSVFTIQFMAFMNVRTFIVFHDCGHNSYTPNKILNYIIGNICGVITFTPIYWKNRHDTHHNATGNIDNNYNYYYNETIYYTCNQYKTLSYIKKYIYKLFHNPIIFLLIIPTINFFILERFSFYKIITRKLRNKPNIIQIFVEQIINNVGVFYLLIFLYKINILYHFLMSNIIFASILLFGFHSEHTFNPSYVVNSKEWTKRNSGLSGSSFIQSPIWFKYFIMGIEYHHIHHTNAKIPGYNLQAYHEEVVSKSNIFDNIVKLSIFDCYNNLWLVLYDEDKKKYITFKEADEENIKSKIN